MCVTPIQLPTGQTVACRNCKRCRDNRVKDLVGRCILEDECSVASSSITLTYGPDESGNTDHWRARNLVLSDFQKFIKLVRYHGYPVRYLVCGEYGTRKERAHWHALLFWQERMPTFQAGELLYGEAMQEGDPYPVGKRFMQRFWPHGWSYWADFGFKEIKYVVKYVVKDAEDAVAQRRASWSRNPVLGAKRLAELAAEYVEQGLVPNAPNYHFRDVRKHGGKGAMYEFRMAGRSLDLFAQSFINQWNARYGCHPPRARASSSELMGGEAVKGRDRDWLVDWCDANHVKSKEEILAWKPDFVRGKPNVRPWIDPPAGVSISYSVGGKCFYYDASDGVRMFWSFNEKGKREWRSMMVSETEGLRRRNLSEARHEVALDRGQTPERYKTAKSGGKY